MDWPERGIAARRQAAQTAGLIALAVAMGVLVLLAIQGPGPAPHREGVATQEERRPERQRSIAVLGDSWMAARGPGDMALASQIADALKSDLVDFSQAGTGYVSIGTSKDPLTPFPDRVTEIALAQPDALLLAGGYDDYRSIVRPHLFSRGTMAESINVTLDAIAAQLPDTQVAVLGPFWRGADPPPEILSIDRVIRTAVAAHSMLFISPVHGRWITGDVADPSSGNAAQYLTPDGSHPNEAGLDYLARRIVDASAGRPSAAPSPS